MIVTFLLILLFLVVAFVLYLVVVFSGTFSYKKMKNMLTNAIQAEVEAWNWSQRFVQAKFQPAKTANNISVRPSPTKVLQVANP